MIYAPHKTLYGNFKMYEVAKSYTAQRLNIDNTPSDSVLEVAEQVAIHIAQPIRDEFGSYTPKSWFRCEALEKEITKHSFIQWCDDNDYSVVDPASWDEYFSRKSHPKGEAIDVEVVGVSNYRLLQWCKENIPVYDQIISEFMVKGDPYAGWVHASRKYNRQEFFSII